jgi:CheY-like chemotaxis protein
VKEADIGLMKNFKIHPKAAAMNAGETDNHLKTILISDDDPQVRGLLRKLLEGEGRFIYEASNGAKSIQSCKQINTDLVLMDIILPWKDGLAAIREIKALCPQTRVIAMSGDLVFTPETYLSIAKTAGADLVLSKPVKNTRLIRAVKDLLMASEAPPPA